MNKPLKIAIGGDHGGFQMKDELAAHLRAQGLTVVDCGTHNKDPVDYPRIAHNVGRLVARHECDLGIVVDGAGIGSAMAANKVRGVRAAACYNEALASNAREHNDANVLTLGAGQITLEMAKKIVDIFLAKACTVDRHLARVKLIKDIEDGALTEVAPVRPPPTAKEANVELSADDIQRVSLRVKEILAQSGVRKPVSFRIAIPPGQLARMIDHTLLKPQATHEDVEKLCQEARKYSFWSVCVNSAYVRQAAQFVRGSDVKVCSVVGFPLGAMPPDIKAAEARRAIREGAREIDMVINVGALKSGDNDAVLNDIRAVVEVCKDGRALSKVILETALLTDEEKVRACQLSMRAGADFVKTSTGFGPGGATAQDIALMSATVAPKKLGVKASGGVRTYSDAAKMIEAGATRIGASSSIDIIAEAKAVAEGKPYTPPTSKERY
jgi:deoxyribose-phosphate aldolase